MFINIVKIILPIAVMLLLGMACRKWHWISDDGAQAFRSVVGKFMLPATLINAFIYTSYSKDIIISAAVIVIWMLAGLGIGKLISAKAPGFGPHLPFLVTTDEVGMLGYSLMALLFATSGVSTLAKLDLGHTGIFFIAFAPMLQMVGGEKPTFKGILKTIFTSYPFDGMLIGIILGLLGVGNIIDSHPAGVIYHAVMDMVTGPTTALILLALGYELSFEKEVMGNVVKAFLIRLPIMAGLGALASLIIFRFVPYTKELMCALLMLVILPPSYSITIFGEMGSDSKFVSTMISFSTLMCLIMFIGLSIFALG